MAVRKQLADAINPQDRGEFRMYRSVMKILHLMNHPFVRSIKDYKLQESQWQWLL